MQVAANEELLVAGRLNQTTILGRDTLVFSGGLSDMMAAKYDSAATVTWAKSAGSSDHLIGSNAFSVSADRCGNTWVCGTMADSMQFDGHILRMPPGAPEPVFLAEYDNSGNYITSMALPGGGDDYSGILTDSKGNFYFAGDFWGTSMILGPDTLINLSGSYEEAFVAKYCYLPSWPLPSAGFISGPSDVCAGSTITLSDTTAGGLWSSSNGNAILVSGTVTGAVAGVDTISYAVSNCYGTSYATQAITINPLPDAGTITGPSAVCAGDSITLADSAAGGAWSDSNPAIASIDPTSEVAHGLAAGVDTVSYSVTNICGTAVALLPLAVLPFPDAGTITAPNYICLGDTIVLTETVAGGMWTVSNPDLLAIGNNFVGVSPGLDTVTYSVTNACGIATTSVAVIAALLPNAGTISGPDTVCQGNAFELLTTVPGGNWSASNASVSLDGSRPAGLLPGVDTLSYTITNSCGSATATQIVMVYPAPVSSIKMAQEMLIADTGFASYQWLRDGSTVPGAVNWAYEVGGPGIYAVVITNQKGCSATAPAVIVPSCTAADIEIYPNPTASKAYVHWCKNVTIRLSSIDGKTICIARDTREIDLSGLPNGTYDLTIFDANNNRVAAKQIKKLSPYYK